MIPTFRKIIHKQLGELLIENKIITNEQLQEALNVQKERGSGLLGEILVELGYVKEEEIATTLSAQYGFPYLPLENYNLDCKVVALIPKNVATQYCLLPIDKLGNCIVISIANPLNVQALEDVEFITGCDTKVFISTSSDIRKAIGRYYKS